MPKWSGRLAGKGDEYINFKGDVYSMHKAVADQTPRGLITEYIFCEECDNSLGVGEGLLREIVHPSTVKSSSISAVKDTTIELNGMKEINDFYSALGGLVLKAHLSKQYFWSDFHLNKKQRNVIFNGIKDPMSHNIGITILKLYNINNFKIGNFTDRIRDDISELRPFDYQFCSAPAVLGCGGFSTVFMFGGLVLSLSFNSRGYLAGERTPDSLKIPILPLDIRHIMEKGEVIGVQIMKHLDESTIIRVINAMKRIPLDSKCPCKVHFTNIDGIKENLNFVNCCYKYWSLERW